MKNLNSTLIISLGPYLQCSHKRQCTKFRMFLMFAFILYYDWKHYFKLYERGGGIQPWEEKGDILDIANNSMLKTSCTISGTSVAGTRK